MFSKAENKIKWVGLIFSLSAYVGVWLTYDSPPAGKTAKEIRITFNMVHSSIIRTSSVITFNNTNIFGMFSNAAIKIKWVGLCSQEWSVYGVYGGVWICKFAN